MTQPVKLRIGVDVDGVLSDFIGTVNVEILNDLWPGRFPLEFQPEEWDFTSGYGMTKEEEDRVWEQIDTRDNFWLNTYPITDNVLRLSDFVTEHPEISVFFITSRKDTKSEMSVLMQTALWLDFHNLIHPNTTVLPVAHASSKKELFKALEIHAHIDDFLPTVVSAKEKGWLMDAAWNRKGRPADVKVVHNMDEFLERIRKETCFPSNV